jgi:hypothetical protein
MPTRRFALLTVVFLTIACQPAGIAAAPKAVETTSAGRVLGQREYTVELRLVLTNSGPGIPEKQNLWVALLRDVPPYQAVTSLTIMPTDYTLVTDEYRTAYRSGKSPDRGVEPWAVCRERHGLREGARVL